MDYDDLNCYRINYGREWLDLGTRYFPVEGAIAAIHTLCSEVELLQEENLELNKLLRNSAKLVIPGEIDSGDALLAMLRDARIDNEYLKKKLQITLDALRWAQNLAHFPEESLVCQALKNVRMRG